MATSGNIGTTTATRNDIIERALKVCNLLPEGENPSSGQIIDGQNTLNDIIKHWTNLGIHLWKYKEAIMWVESNKETYPLYSIAGTANVTNEFYQTALTTDAFSTDVVITVDSTENISIGDIIGIVLDDKTIQWTKVSSVVGGITLEDALTGDASSGNIIYNYTDKISKPVSIQNARRVDSNSLQETPIILVGRQEYFTQPNKRTTGQTVNLYYDRQRKSGAIYLWPAPANDSDFYIRFTYQTQFEIFDSANDESDFPHEYMKALIYCLADEFCIEYGVMGEIAQRISEKANRYLTEARSFDKEMLSVYAQPDLDGSGYGGNTDGTN